jgi:DNA topoisomerase-2
MSNKRQIEEIYQKKTQHEHIMLRPDTYIGSVEFDKQNLYVYNSEKQEIEFREVTYVPGLYKIFGKF